MFYKTKYNSPFGKITLASDGKNIIGLWFEGQKYFKNSVKGELTINDNIKVFHTAKNWLDRYFRGEKPAISEIPLAPGGSEFRQQVWKLLCKIPYGEVSTYAGIAKQIAEEKGLKKMSAQAVGGAIGHNPISIIIPCHRVIGSNGSLTGYAGGIGLKKKLLELEGREIKKLRVKNI